jgi:delta-1-pyrroline-5-carboxylate synthetase
MTPTEQAAKAREAARALRAASTSDRNRALERLAEALLDRQGEILAENAQDVAEGRIAVAEGRMSASLAARLKLSPDKLATLAEGVRAIAAMDEPLGRVLAARELAEGLVLRQVSSPIGVLLVIFESRPDVLPQVAALALKSGNGLVLKGGKEATRSNRVLHRVLREAIAPLPASCVELVETRTQIAELLELDELIDLVIPRGSNSLVRHIQGSTRIPVLGHADGVCHVYVDAAADLEQAIPLVVDSKCDYPAACNAMETLLVHRDVDPEPLVQALQALGVTVHREPEDWHTEYSALECALRVVDSLEQAVEHIHAHGSGHTEAILTTDAQAAARFLEIVDSACVFHDCSTRFADGFRFGLGAEVGISTARIHARGPVGIEGLLTTRWILRGRGQTVAPFSRGEADYTHRELEV